MKQVLKGITKGGILLLIGLIGFSCMEESGFTIIWTGLEVEFEEASRPNGSVRRVVTQNSANQVDQTTVRVNLVGAHIDQQVQVTIGVDPSSTAVRNVHFRLPQNQVTIAPNTSFVEVPIEILTGNLASGEEPNLVLQILDAGNTKISANYNKVTVEIRLSCPSALAGRYSTVNVGTGGTTNSQVTITEIEPFTYRISDITGGVYAQVFGASDNPAIFTELCGVITITDQPDVVFGGGVFNGTGRVNADGTLRINWRNDAEESGVTTLTRIP
ncbi:hypothetical protein ADIS_1806 [Lunatimonas lonarensis]|uniref:Uncharacterized protein n=1 Tax=Lunatimonas lonarensis TaxID=1232681 RepID=R7ZU57_9BACT|nr:DUF4843 domain-containing protein [Lunatimonas lonarensis]EON77587.1 hypothetical protein ADIS_1806 [Lunatimonas lonarensis]